MKTPPPTSADLLSALRRRLKLTSNQAVAKYLGVSTATVSNWASKKPALTATRVARAITLAASQARKAAYQDAVRPIIEMYALDPQPQDKGDGWVMWKKDVGRYGAELRGELEKSNGVYVFYDSSGHALYVGKAKRMRLWGEMNNAYNRNRAVQTVRLTRHPTREQAFVRSEEKHRQISPRRLTLCDLASYVSAYAVAPEMIDSVEAMLVRAFPNDVLNVRMENFSHVRQAKQAKRATNAKRASR